MTTPVTIVQPSPILPTEITKKQQFRPTFKLQRSKSDDFLCNRVASQATDIQKKSNGFSFLQNTIPTTILIDHKKKKKQKKGLKLINKLKKLKKKNPLDYRKNICGYITKKIIRQFTSLDYMPKVQQLCDIYGCDYNQAKFYYASKIQHVTGPSHIPSLLDPENRYEKRFKKAFRQFFEWFLRQKYLRYILIQGKMSDKRAYIEYKNNTLISLITRNYYDQQSQEQYANVKIQQMCPENYRIDPKFMENMQLCKQQYIQRYNAQHGNLNMVHPLHPNMGIHLPMPVHVPIPIHNYNMAPSGLPKSQDNVKQQYN